MGSVADCYDNAVCERFFATLELAKGVGLAPVSLDVGPRGLGHRLIQRGRWLKNREAGALLFNEVPECLEQSVRSAVVQQIRRGDRRPAILELREPHL